MESDLQGAETVMGASKTNVSMSPTMTSRKTVAELKRIYGLDLDAEASHRLSDPDD